MYLNVTPFEGSVNVFSAEASSVGMMHELTCYL